VYSPQAKIENRKTLLFILLLIFAKINAALTLKNLEHPHFPSLCA